MSIKNFNIILVVVATLILLSNVQVEAKKHKNKPVSCRQSFWTPIEHSGDLPPALWDGASAYDEKRNLFYIFGGLNGTFPSDFPTNDFFVFDVDTYQWTNLSSPTAPVARAEAMMWVDKKSGNVYMAGGRHRFRTGMNLEYNTTHVFDVKTRNWSLVPQTFEQELLANRSTEAHTIGKRAYAYSGSTSTLPAYVNIPGALQTNVVYFDRKSGGWHNVSGITGVIPTPRVHHHLVYSKELNSFFTYGGYTMDPLRNTTFGIRNFLGDLWRFDLNTLRWTNMPFNTTNSPGLRDNAKFIHADDKGLYLAGGSSYEGVPLNDIWRYDFEQSQWERVIVLAPIDPVTNKQVAPPTPIGAFYFTRTTSDGHEFWIYGGSATEFGGALYNGMWKLIVPKY
eukprot:gene4085-5113_t